MANDLVFFAEVPLKVRGQAYNGLLKAINFDGNVKSEDIRTQLVHYRKKDGNLAEELLNQHMFAAVSKKDMPTLFSADDTSKLENIIRSNLAPPNKDILLSELANLLGEDYAGFQHRDENGTISTYLLENRIKTNKFSGYHVDKIDDLLENGFFADVQNFTPIRKTDRITLTF